MESTDKIELLSRTRQRNMALRWPLDWGGILLPLVEKQRLMNELSTASVENYIAISEETWGIKEHQRDMTIAISQAEIDQDRQNAEAKVATGRKKLAIQRTTDEYVLSAKIRDAVVKRFIMAAKEYAGMVEQEQLAVEVDRAALAVTKEEVRQDEINAKIYYEQIQHAQVEADLAKAQVDVAKAHVRAALAGIEVGQAEIEVIEAEIQKFMSEAEKNELRANVAMVYAEIMTKKLSEIRLQVGQKEIENGFVFIQSRLNDILTLFDVRKDTEAIRQFTEEELLEELGLTYIAERYKEDAKIREILYGHNTADIRWQLMSKSTGEPWKPYVEGDDVGNYFDGDITIKGQEMVLLEGKTELLKEKVETDNEKRDKQTWAEVLVNAAQEHTYMNRKDSRTVVSSSVERISGK